MNGRLTPNRRRFFRNELRNARAATFRDSENFSEILFVLERFGSFLLGQPGNLGKYEACITEVASASPLHGVYGQAWGTKFGNLFRVVRQARNDSMHIGAYARHAANNSVLISMILEDALMAEADTLQEFMVQDPVCAELWQPIGLIRQRMLANSFSFLPLRHAGSPAKWALVADVQLAKHLRGAGTAERSKRMAQSLESAVSSGEILLSDAQCFGSETKVTDVMSFIDQKPILLFNSDSHDNLVGLVTAFDLL